VESKELPQRIDPPLGHVLDNGDGRVRPGQGLAEEAVRTLLGWVGEDPQRDGLRDTPGRVCRALTEMTQGYRVDPGELLATTFEESYDELILLRGIPFSSLCEHHMSVFTGVAAVGYIPRPGGPVVGLSKLARLVDCFARRLQLQERLTRQIAEALTQHLDPLGVGVLLRAEHSCLSCRGAQKAGAEMVTSCMLGVFREKGEARAEFLTLCGGGT
jgi:GTP cyclohydrolase IA